MKMATALTFLVGLMSIGSASAASGTQPVNANNRYLENGHSHDLGTPPGVDSSVQDRETARVVLEGLHGASGKLLPAMSGDDIKVYTKQYHRYLDNGHSHDVDESLSTESATSSNVAK
jgi:hypothetical protein